MPETATLGAMRELAPAEELVAAMTSRDFARLGRALSPTAEARFLLPRGPEVQEGREDIVRRIQGWFGDATAFEVLDSGDERVGRRRRVNWRFRLVRDGETREVIEQVAFVDIAPEGVARIDLVCSGFLPAPAGEVSG